MGIGLAGIAEAANERSFERVVLMAVEESGGKPSVREVHKRLDELAAAFRKSGKPLRDWFFGEAGFRGVGRPGRSPQEHDLAEVIDARRGSCLPLVATYLVLAERTGLDAIPVATPRHVFVRERHPEGRRNVELLDRGVDRPDWAYLNQEDAPRDDPRSHELLRELSPRQFLAYLLNNEAVLARSEGDTKRAARLYRRALRHDADCQPCHYNYANLLAAGDQARKARKHYDAALEMHPWDKEVQRNRSLLEERVGGPAKAQR